MSPLRHRRTLLSAAAVSAAALVLAACGSSSDTSADAAGGSAAAGGVTVHVGSLVGSDTGLALAKSEGVLDSDVQKAGGSVSYSGPFPAFAPAAEAMKAGDVDVTLGGLLSWVGGVAANPDLEVFAYQPEQPGVEGIVAAKGSGVTDLASLKGKTVAYNAAGTGDYLLRLALAKAGLSESDIQAVNLAPADAATAFASGKIDAWATWGSFLASAATSDGASVVADGGDLGSENDTVYVVSKSFADAHPQQLKAVYDALVAAVSKAGSDPSVYDKARQADGLSQPVIDFMSKVPPVQVKPVTPDVVTRWQQAADFWTSQGVIPTSVDVSKEVVENLG